MHQIMAAVPGDVGQCGRDAQLCVQGFLHGVVWFGLLVLLATHRSSEFRESPVKGSSLVFKGTVVVVDLYIIIR